MDADFGSEGVRGGAPAASPARPGSCSARASPAATIAAWNSGGPVTRLSRITVICARRGGRAQARRARARALVPRPTLPTLMSPCAPDSSMLCRRWVRPCRAAARPRPSGALPRVSGMAARGRGRGAGRRGGACHERDKLRAPVREARGDRLGQAHGHARLRSTVSAIAGSLLTIQIYNRFET